MTSRRHPASIRNQSKGLTIAGVLSGASTGFGSAFFSGVVVVFFSGAFSVFVAVDAAPYGFDTDLGSVVATFDAGCGLGATFGVEGATP